MVVACTANDIYLSIARVCTTHKTCSSSNQAAVACCCDTRNAVRRNYTVTLAGVVEVLFYRNRCSLDVCNLNGVALDCNIGTVKNVANHRNRYFIACNGICSDEKTAIESLFACCVVCYIYIGIALNYNIVHVHAVHIHRLETPLVVIGTGTAVGPCCEVIDTADLEIIAAVAAVECLGKIVVTVLAYILS